jgi:hypothetical protein
VADLQSKRLIVAKGCLFLVIAAVSFGLVVAEAPSWKVAGLLVLLCWSSCRFYYFLFYVLEKYVDPSLRYAGLWAMLREIQKRRRRP